MPCSVQSGNHALGWVAQLSERVVRNDALGRSILCLLTQNKKASIPAGFFHPGAGSIFRARTLGRALFHVARDEHLAGTWARTIGAVSPRANHPGAAAVSVIERPALGGLASSGRTPDLRRTVIALAVVGGPGRAVK